MNCMKCGRETLEEQVFCPECLEEMKKYPVSPTTTVRLPRRTDPQPSKKAARRKLPPEEEQIRQLKKRIRVLTWLLAVALALVLALSVPAVTHLLEDDTAFMPGQNYSSALD